MDLSSDEVLDPICGEVIARGSIAPVGVDRAERELWQSCDLASAMEGALHLLADPTALNEDARAVWLPMVGHGYRLPALEACDDFTRRFWLLENGERAGTIAVGDPLFGASHVSIRSLYTFRERRGRGIASRVLEDFARAAVAHGLEGLQLSVEWTWQQSLRFSLARGFWVRSWKDDLRLVREPRLPPWFFEHDGRAACFGAIRDGRRERALTARRDGELLVLEKRPLLEADEIRSYALGTFAVLLALQGWPLVRSRASWAKRRRWSDSGEPEGLAYKIGVFERSARDGGWVVDTPQIRGLAGWQTWADGQDYGRREQRVRDIEAILRARALRLGEERRHQLEALRDEWRLDQLFHDALTATSIEDWWSAQTHQ